MRGYFRSVTSVRSARAISSEGTLKGGTSLAKVPVLALLTILVCVFGATAAPLNLDDPQHADHLEIGPTAQSTLFYSPWVKVCGQAQGSDFGEICFTIAVGRSETGTPVFSASLIEPKNETRKILRITLPLGMQLPAGTRITVDQGQSVNVPYLVCDTDGCIADYVTDESAIAHLKTGRNLFVQAVRRDGQIINYVLPLADFANAYSSQPIDTKVFNEQQKQMQDTLQKLASKKLQEHRQ